MPPRTSPRITGEREVRIHRDDAHRSRKVYLPGGADVRVVVHLTFGVLRLEVPPDLGGRHPPREPQGLDHGCLRELGPDVRLPADPRRPAPLAGGRRTGAGAPPET